MDQQLVRIYSRPMMGGELPYFEGRQHGNGWLRTLGRIAFPILRRIAGVAADTAEDVIVRDKQLLPSLTSNIASNITGTKRKAINKRSKKFPIKVRRKS